MLIGEFYSAKPQRTSWFHKCIKMPSQPQEMVILLALEPTSQYTTRVLFLRGVEPSSPQTLKQWWKPLRSTLRRSQPFQTTFLPDPSHNIRKRILPSGVVYFQCYHLSTSSYILNAPKFHHKHHKAYFPIIAPIFWDFFWKGVGVEKPRVSGFPIFL